MKKIFLGMLVGTLIVGTVTTAMAGPFTWRETRQQARIYQGVDCGQITNTEYQRLEQQQGRIEAHRQRAWSDGILTPGEACLLTREQNRASRHIWRTKHNGFYY
jgi:gas vesicle protein